MTAAALDATRLLLGFAFGYAAARACCEPVVHPRKENQ